MDMNRDMYVKGLQYLSMVSVSRKGFYYLLYFSLVGVLKLGLALWDF